MHQKFNEDQQTFEPSNCCAALLHVLPQVDEVGAVKTD